MKPNRILHSSGTSNILEEGGLYVVKKPQKLENGWSKSPLSENKVALIFDFRDGARKSCHWFRSYGYSVKEPK